MALTSPAPLPLPRSQPPDRQTTTIEATVECGMAARHNRFPPFGNVANQFAAGRRISCDTD